MRRTRFLLELAKKKQIEKTDVEYSGNCDESTAFSSEAGYESSGTEYLPPSSLDFLSRSEDYSSPMSPNSPISPAITFVQDIVVEEQSSSSKVFTYLKNMEIGCEHNVLTHTETYETVTNSGIIEKEQTSQTSKNLKKFAIDGEHNVPEHTDKAELFNSSNLAQASLTNLAKHKENKNLSTVIKESGYQDYKKKDSARERPTICPLCYVDVTTHFTRHLLRHHKDNEIVVQIESLKAGSKERLALVSALRKQGNFHLRTEKNVLHPVRNSTISDVEYFVCPYCLGHYVKRNLYKHVKICKNKPLDKPKSGKQYCLTKSQTFLASIISKNSDFLKNSRIKKEVFEIMRPDDISFEAKSDPLICLYGEMLLNKHKRQQMSTVVSNKIREMGRLLIALKSIKPNIPGFFDALQPENFQLLITAVKNICGFNETSKDFKAPSLALHLGTSLKMMCDIAIKIILERRNIPGIKWDDQIKRKSEIKDLKKLIEGHWCAELSSLALKNLKEKQWQKPKELPLTSDIQMFQTYVNRLADDAYEQLSENLDVTRNYKTLTECVLALTVMFNRKRVGDVQYLKMATYSTHNNTLNQEAFVESLTPVEQLISKKFKRVVTDGKGSKPIPILFPQRLQKFITCLLKTRTNSSVVPKTNPYLFANPGSENRWMAGVNIISKLAKNCGAQNPKLLTSSKFRKHIATTLQLMTLEQNEMEQIATFMGHTKKTHEEFYRLPQDIYQTAKVAKILLLLEKGKGKEFKGKNLNEIELDNTVYYSSESEVDEKEENNLHPLLQHISRNTEKNCCSPSETLPLLNNEKKRKRTVKNRNKEKIKSSGDCKKNKNEEESESDESEEETINKKGKLSGRIRWTAKEKDVVKKHFARHIKAKIAPKKHECEDLMALHKDLFTNKDWVRVKTLVYNTFRLQ